MLDKIKQQGIVIEAFPNAFFKVKLDNQKEIIAYISGRMKFSKVKVLIGDRVEIIMSPCGDKGRIVYCFKR